MTYRTLDHTADLAIEVTAGSLDELFAESILAMTDCITRLDRVVAEESHQVSLAAPDLDQLLVGLLNEVVYLHETEALVLSREASLSVSETDSGWSIAGTLSGEEFDLDRHGLKTLIKAVDVSPVECSAHAGWLGCQDRLRSLIRPLWVGVGRDWLAVDRRPD